MNFLELAIEGNVQPILDRLTTDATLNLQSVGEAQGIESVTHLLQRQKVYLGKEINKINVFRTFEDNQSLVIEYDILLNNTFDLPLAAVFVKQDDKFSAIRTYHSVYPLTEGHEFRASLFTTVIDLTEPASVVAYFKAIAEGSTEKTLATLSFADDVYFKEPAGWRWNHKGEAHLKEHYDHFFSDGGIPLTFHRYVFDTQKGTFAGEYSCERWGSAIFKPQAGISIYDMNKQTGLITGIRVYDNVDWNYK